MADCVLALSAPRSQASGKLFLGCSVRVDLGGCTNDDCCDLVGVSLDDCIHDGC